MMQSGGWRNTDHEGHYHVLGELNKGVAFSALVLGLS